MPDLTGMASKNRSNGSSPPADAPIPTIGTRLAFLIVFFLMAVLGAAVLGAALGFAVLDEDLGVFLPDPFDDFTITMHPARLMKASLLFFIICPQLYKD